MSEMNENKPENKFITLLSDIDEKFITDMAAERAKEKSGKRALQKAAKKDLSQKPAKEKETPYQSAKIVTVSGKKKTFSYAKLFSYAAAALAITAAAILGSRFINEKPPVDPLGTGDTEITVQDPTNSTIPSVDPNETPITYTAIKDIDEKKFRDMWEETDISEYPVIDFSYLPNIDDAYETIYAGYGSGEERIITKAILDTKKCGDLDLSIIGYGLFTDGRIYPDKMIALFGYSLVLQKNGEVVSSLVLNESIDVLFKGRDDSTEFLYMLEKEYIGEFTSIADFGDHQIILARLIENDSVIARTQFFGVKNNALYLCSTSHSYQAEYISGVYKESDIQYDVGEPHNCVITDAMLDREYVFDFSVFDIVSYEIVTQEDPSETDIEKYSFIKDVNIPEIDLREFEGDFYDKTKAVMAGGLPRVMFNMIRERDYAVYLVGEYVSRSGSSSSDNIDYLNTEISCNLRILIYQDDKYIGCIVPDESLYFASMTENEYNELLPALFVTADDVALLVKRGLSDSYYGTDQFYAVKDGTIYCVFNGYCDVIDTPPPEWTETALKHDYIEWDEDTESVICGFYRYEFDFSELETEAIGIYNVYWLEEEPK